MTSPADRSASAASRWQRFSVAAVRAFHAYGAWLAGISWRRFALLSVLLMIVVTIVQSLPPFKWTVTESVEAHHPTAPPVPAVPAVPAVRPEVRIDVPPASEGARRERAGRSFDVSVDARGVHVRERQAESGPAAASTPAGGASAPGDPEAVSAVEIHVGDKGVRVAVPVDATSTEVREAIEEAKQAVIDAIEEARDAQREAADVAAEAERNPGGGYTRTRTVQHGEFLSDLAALWIVASAIIKITYKGRMQAEVKAAQATETAEAESLKRQVVEARMAAMQAQVEPHFLFNTLASIDHLIETDPPRASQMQRNLIALLRASMPSLRDTAETAAPRALGQELAVVRPYIDILRVRMEERLEARIEVPDGLLSAEFPAMMMQTLVENAIRHGLEPKPEGGQLVVRAEIVHGKLRVQVADTGVGFGMSGTGGTGVGLANIRERLQMLHGGAASLSVEANQPCGTVVTITVPYRAIAGAELQGGADRAGV